MAESTIVKNFRDGTITFGDGTRTYTVAYEAGDLQFTPPRYNDTLILDRGEPAGARKTTFEPGSYTFTMYMRSLTEGTANVLVDILEDSGGSTAWTTTGGTGYEPRTYTITFAMAGAVLGDTADSTIVFTKCRSYWSGAEGDPNTISIEGAIWGTYTRTGPT